ncbi:MAG TPA: AAA family ATPase [Solirubrobacteraceae bacterium]|nr:AAA family ATPase [Solirubrobacteraceae bacterium]
MRTRGVLVGRGEERARLEAALELARAGAGSLVLLSGEAGVGKSRLAAEVAEGARLPVLTGAATHGGTAPYGPVVAALRCHLRAHPGALGDSGPLAPQLALLLPELGAAPAPPDRPTLFEAVRQAFAHVAAAGCTIVLLDDLHWSDQATLDLLGALAGPLAELPLLVVAAYRSDGLPRDHGLRRLRHELRRAGRLEELVLGPLDLDATTELLEHALGGAPSAALARTVHDRTQGVPFFVEELAAALRMGGLLTESGRGFALAAGGEVPIPDTVRDAVLMTTADLSEAARVAAETAAVAGPAFDLEVVAGLAGAAGVAELVDSGLVREDGAGGAAFRHALTRDAICADVPWLRRRTLHRRLAEALQGRGAPSRQVAAHWVGAREEERARAALLEAAAESEAVHAYRDAAAAGRQALELWPEREDDEARSEALQRYAATSELAGDLAEAARAWRELAAIRAATGDEAALAEAQRRLAAVHDLRGDRDAALAARRAAAAAFAATGHDAEAAVEQLAIANQLRIQARHGEAAELARDARAAADRAGRLDLRARALGIEGMATAKGGDYEGGVETVRSALALALEHDLTLVAAELYQRLSVAVYDSSDYRRAQETLGTALDLCRAAGDAGTEVACVTCLAYVLRERGEWPRAAEICVDLIGSGTAVFVAEGLLGAIHGAQGRYASARRLLTSSLAVSSRVRHYNMAVDATLGLARVAAAEGHADEARQRCRAILEAWRASDDHHYATNALRWSAAHLARAGETADAHGCVEALSAIASATGYADALASLGHALAETALAEGDADTAAEQLTRAVEQHRALDLPFQRAEIELRAGVALSAAGEREPGLERLCDAYRTARKLGARPLAAEAAREVAALGESVVRRLGRRAAADAEASGLSRREVEVVRLLAVGRTNREIAQELFLSRRTVDMHVRNILRKLDCRSRVEAAARANELGLLVG